MLERVIAVYEKTFAEVPEGRAYLENRGLTDAGLFSCHRVGYANGKLKDLLPSGGAVRDELKAIGVLLDNPSTGSGQACHERFANCVTFPVYGPDGRLVTIYGRFIDHPEPGRRSATSNKRHVYLSDRSTGLWNAAAVKTYSEIILVESVIDALSVMMAGHRNVIAIQGTNGFDEADIQTLNTHGVQAVTLLLDGDDAGKKAAERLTEKLSSFSCRALALPDGEDPNSFLRKHGAEKLAQFIPEGQDMAADSTRARGETLSGSSGTSSTMGDGEAPPPAGPVADNGNARPGGTGDHASGVVTYGLRKYRIMGLEKGPRKLKATVRIEHAGKLHVDTLDFYSAESRRVLAMDLCRIFEETPETIEGDIEKLLRHCEPCRNSSCQKSEIRVSGRIDAGG